ncbi:MAG: hypothetical protein JHC74_00355 [Thermoleophilia bacterium]|nr:hypothetical protein [Thermoleophilia bacterium]
MLDITCEDCGRTLIGLDRITSVHATDEGLRVAYVCWCGLPGAEITGRIRRPRTAAPRREPAAA